MGVDTKAELTQALIPIGLCHVKELLEEEVRWGSGINATGRRDMTGGGSRGGLYLLDQKLPIMVPRIRDQGGDKEVRLRSYERLQEPWNRDEGAWKQILHGLSCQSYEECAAVVLEAFGISGSSVSRRYIWARTREFSLRALPGEKSTDK